jgi:hypothetical protein
MRRYHCTGHLTEWTSCNYTTTEPARRPFKIPNSMKEDNAYLNQFTLVPRVVCWEGAVGFRHERLKNDEFEGFAGSVRRL